MVVKQKLKRFLAVLIEPKPEDPSLGVRRRLAVFGVGVAFFALFQILSQFPWVVEAVFGRGLSPVMVWSLSGVTGVFGFSMLEFALLIYFAWWWFSLWTLTLEVRRGARSIRNAMADIGLRGLRDFGVVVAFFYVTWGFNYARPSLRERLDWPEWQSPETAELEQLAEQSVRWANEAYVLVHGTDDAGNPTSFPEDTREIDDALEEGFKRAVEILVLQKSMAWTYARVKYPIAGHLMARFSTAGFFFPWTGEANVLGDMPAISRPMSMAHEKAHQRGTGPELEATFLGFVAATEAPHPIARYSASVYVMRSLLNILFRVDPDRARELAGLRVAGISRDLEDLNRYWAQFQSVGNAIGRAVNDRYLKMNRVHGGVANYSMSVQLLITFLEQNDREMDPSEDPNPIGETTPEEPGS